MPVNTSGIYIPKRISDATATPSDVLKDKIFYNNNGRQVGIRSQLTFIDQEIKTIEHKLDPSGEYVHYDYGDAWFYSQNSAQCPVLICTGYKEYIGYDLYTDIVTSFRATTIIGMEFNSHFFHITIPNIQSFNASVESPVSCGVGVVFNNGIAYVRTTVYNLGETAPGNVIIYYI